MKTAKNSFFNSHNLRAGLLIASLCAGASVFACTIYFTNNTPGPVLITLADNSAAIPVAMNKTKMFGDGTKHAEFTVWQKSKGQDRFKRVAFLKQHGCNRGKRIDINMSDVQSGQVNTGLFTITMY
jgi:hypothetical protein